MSMTPEYWPRLPRIRSGTAAMDTSTAMNGFMEMMGSSISA